jgi:hypothetical protein
MANPFKAHPRVKNTDGRVPTTTLSGQKEAEGNSNLRPGGSLGKTSGAGDDAIERMTTRNAASFRNDIVKRNSKIKGRRGNRGKACD